MLRIAHIISGGLAKLPIHAYRWTLKPFVGWECRHLPSCSQYALDAIDMNGAWRGSWLTLARICRCRPGGTAGFDPCPDINCELHPLAPWRYGRWTKASIESDGSSGKAGTTSA